MPYRVATIDNANAALALTERAQVDLDRDKRTQTTCLAVAVPTALVVFAAYIAPVWIPHLVLMIMGPLFIAGAAVTTYAVVIKERQIRAGEERRSSKSGEHGRTTSIESPRRPALAQLLPLFLR